MLTTMLASTAFAQSEKVTVEKTIALFAQAADTRNVEQLRQVLHDEFRVSMNRLFGSNTLSIMPKAVYLQMIEEGKLGGEKRIITILGTDISQNTASATVIFKGKTLTFQSYLQLVKTEAGQWQVLGDLPTILP
jgi:Putative lumazine-binding